MLTNEETIEVKEYLISTCSNPQQMKIEMFKFENKITGNCNTNVDNSRDTGIIKNTVLWSYNKMYYPSLNLMFDRIKTISVNSCCVERSFSI